MEPAGGTAIAIGCCADAPETVPSTPSAASAASIFPRDISVLPTLSILPLDAVWQFGRCLTSLLDPLGAAGDSLDTTTFRGQIDHAGEGLTSNGPQPAGQVVPPPTIATPGVFLTVWPRIAISMASAGLSVRALFRGRLKPLKTNNKPTERSRSGHVRAPGTNTRTERCSQSLKLAANSIGLPRRT